MRHYAQIIPKLLRRQSKRSMLAITGLVLAVALITSTGILGSSLAASHIDYVKRTNGSYHGTFASISREQANTLAQHINIGKLGVTRTVGIARYPDKGMAITAAAYNNEALSLLNMELVAGRMPQGGNEIAVETWVLRELGRKPELGQSITLEFLSPSGTKKEATFTLTGVLKNDGLAQVIGYSRAVVGEDVFSGVPEQTKTINALVEVKDGLSPRQTLENIGRLLEVNPSYNESLLLAQSGNSEKLPFLLLGILVLAVTAAAINNIFHITVLERIRQYGLLRSIGAAPRQIRTVVFGEALALCIIAVPLGLIVGIAGVHGLVYTASFLQNTVTRVVIPPWVLIYAMFISLLAIMVSAYKPARLAARIEPLDALRGTVSALPVNGYPRRRWHTLIERFFGISGQVACRNLQRHEKQFKVTVFSITICIVLILVFSIFLSGADPSQMLQNQYPGQFMLSTGSINPSIGFTEEDVMAISAMKGVSEIYTTQERGVMMRFPANKLTPEYMDFVENRLKQDRGKFIKNGEYSSSGGLYSFSENIIDLAAPLLTAGEINPAKMQKENHVLLVNNYRAGDQNSAATSLQPGDEITLNLASFQGGNISQGEDNTFIVGGILSGYPFPMEMVTIGVAVIVHPEVLQELNDSVLYRRLDIKTKEDADMETLTAALQTYAEQLPMGRLRSYEQQIQELEAQKMQFAIFFFSLIAVIVLISILSIINTISTNLLLRTREFGIYRAVGLSEKQLKKMIRVEGLCYGVVSAFWGTLVGNILGATLFYLGKQQLTYLKWSFPWQVTLYLLFGSILLALLATTAPVRRITSMNVTEAIRSVG